MRQQTEIMTTPKHLSLWPGVINALAVLWAEVIVYLAFSNLQLACVGFFSFTLSYLVGKYT